MAAAVQGSPPVAQGLVAVACAAVALAIRGALGQFWPELPYYALTYPAALVATLLTGWRGGILCLGLCQLGAWYFFLPPQFGFVIRSISQGLGLVLATLSGLAIVWVTDLYHRERARGVELERRRTLDRELGLQGLLTMFDNAYSFMALLRGEDLRLEYVNRAYLELLGQDRSVLGQPLLLARPHSSPHFIGLMREVLATGRPVRFDNEAVSFMRGGEHVTRHLEFVYHPVRNADGVVDAVFVEGHDLTAAVTARRSLEESERRLRLAVQVSAIGVWEWRLDTNEMFYSDQAKAICGFPVEEPVTYEMAVAATHPEDFPVTSAQAARMRDPDNRENRPFEYRIVRPNGDVRWVVAHGEMVFEAVDGERRATMFLGTLMDITDRKAAEEQLRLLAHEVDHRSNNLLALVQGAVERSHAADTETLKAVIAGRVQALSRSHQLLAEARWNGASLMRLLQEELQPFALGDEERVAIRGEDGALAPQAAQGLAMCIHELATNAAKYGALSTPEGRVRVTVRRVDDALCRIVWTETGGPAVAEPTRRGFGSSVLARALASCGGEVRLDWRPEGLVAELLAPTLG